MRYELWVMSQVNMTAIHSFTCVATLLKKAIKLKDKLHREQLADYAKNLIDELVPSCDYQKINKNDDVI